MPRKKKSNSWLGVILLIFIAAVGSAILVLQFNKELRYRLETYLISAPGLNEELKVEHAFRNFPGGILGIDVSEYQGKINFRGLQLKVEEHPIQFVFIRASMGDDGVDGRFRQNWEGFGKLPVKRGAYHYYRPNENSARQAENFIKTTQLKSGDLIPVLDIEKHSTIQSKDRLREGLKNWLKIVEEHYRVKPIIYTGDRFFWEVLHKQGFDRYPIWVANYNLIHEPQTDGWLIWQFSEKGKLAGIKEKIDLNIWRGDQTDLEQMLLP